KILAIDNCSCRRMVVSAARFWWHCTTGTMQIISVDNDHLQQGDKNVTVHVVTTTDHLGQVYFPSGVTVKEIDLFHRHATGEVDLAQMVRRRHDVHGHILVTLLKMIVVNGDDLHCARRAVPPESGRTDDHASATAIVDR